ncbi:hypothetical protein PAHAL_4G225200 [Panicum hallii]|jgi:hypothetical protein|uniref:Uncharacterized protein n=1 Tax=Panicum hallii TaxID=206008 RepID=A0A2S3HK67_9POAL|nr:hypothetical protein PAHAL_4G225200 [Panicum hallii]
MLIHDWRLRLRGAAADSCRGCTDPCYSGPDLVLLLPEVLLSADFGEPGVVTSGAGSRAGEAGSGLAQHAGEMVGWGQQWQATVEASPEDPFLPMRRHAGRAPSSPGGHSAPTERRYAGHAGSQGGADAQAAAGGVQPHRSGQSR